MPRSSLMESRGSEMSSQRQSPRVPLHLKTTAASEANSLHRLTTDRSSPKPDEHRSPRSGPLHEKKRGIRAADLETKLGQAQEELKKLKEQLASAEAAKRDAEQELDEAKKQIPVAPSLPATEEEEEEPLPTKDATAQQHPDPVEHDLPKPEPVPVEPPATDVFEVVPPALVPAEPREGNEDNNEEAVEEVAKVEETETMIEVDGQNKLGTEEYEEEKSKQAEFPESPEISELRAKLAEKEKELEIRSAENESLKKQTTEATENAVAAQAKIEELGRELHCVEEELRESRTKEGRLGERLEAAEASRAALEAEMKQLKVQTGQWRKAAEAAAAVIAAGDGMEAGGGTRVAERCGSMDKHLSGYGGSWSPMMDEEEGLGGGKRKGAGIRMFGDLWKKKGQHK